MSQLWGRQYFKAINDDIIIWGSCEVNNFVRQLYDTHEVGI